MPLLRNHHIIWSLNIPAAMASANVPSGTNALNVGPGTAISPGGATNIYTVISSARPGFVHAHFQGGQVTREDNNPLPSAVEQQLQKLQDVEYASVSQLVVGPNYPSELPTLMVASSIYVDLQRLVGPNPASSPFLTGALSAVKGYIQYLQATGDFNNTMPLVPSPVSVGVAPNTAVEKQVALVLRRSLGISVAQ
jgi:hypothetical protein